MLKKKSEMSNRKGKCGAGCAVVVAVAVVRMTVETRALGKLMVESPSVGSQLFGPW
jgi:hypothetical protein